jgi:BR serine/threonine kinase
MEFSENGSLLDLVMSIHANERKINLDMARFWFRRILMGVHFMHSRDFVHLDIKHDNILLNQANEPKLADFGFTHHVNGNISFWRYTKEYAAPEVLRGTGSYDGKKADIYSVGVVFYSALTCKYPTNITWPSDLED